MQLRSGLKEKLAELVDTFWQVNWERKDEDEDKEKSENKKNENTNTNRHNSSSNSNNVKFETDDKDINGKSPPITPIDFREVFQLSALEFSFSHGKKTARTCGIKIEDEVSSENHNATEKTKTNTNYTAVSIIDKIAKRATTPIPNNNTSFKPSSRLKNGGQQVEPGTKSSNGNFGTGGGHAGGPTEASSEVVENGLRREAGKTVTIATVPEKRNFSLLRGSGKTGIGRGGVGAAGLVGEEKAGNKTADLVEEKVSGEIGEIAVKIPSKSEMIISRARSKDSKTGKAEDILLIAENKKAENTNYNTSSKIKTPESHPTFSPPTSSSSVILSTSVPPTCKIGNNVYIGPDVVVGDNCVFEEGVCISGRVDVGNGCWFKKFSSIGHKDQTCATEFLHISEKNRGEDGDVGKDGGRDGGGNLVTNGKMEAIKSGSRDDNKNGDIDKVNVNLNDGKTKSEEVDEWAVALAGNLEWGSEVADLEWEELVENLEDCDDEGDDHKKDDEDEDAGDDDEKGDKAEKNILMTFKPDGANVGRIEVREIGY
jgi:hypothetical protein